MDVTFSTATLAALCNSERRLAQRWGPQLGRMIGCRLLDLAAVDAARLERLPTVEVSTDGGETIIDFGGEIVVRGVIYSSDVEGRQGRGNTDRIVITRLEVKGSD
jgi:hypothetical protein